MKVSVIIPVYNRKKMVLEAIESVVQQTCLPYEIIVVDDGSTDGTPEAIAKRYPDVRLIVTEINMGVSQARNIGIKGAKGDWIALLDSDDLWDRKKLEKQLEYHKNHPDILISQTDERWLKNGRPLNKKRYHEKIDGWNFLVSLERCMISPSCVMLKKELFEKHGYFDVRMPVCEDYDMWLRLTHRYPVGLIKERLVIKRGGHDDQLSFNYEAMDRFRVYSLLKILDSEPLTPQFRNSAISMLIKKATILKQGAEKRGNRFLSFYYERLIKRFTKQLYKKVDEGH